MSSPLLSLTLSPGEVVVPPLAIGAMYWGTTVPTDDAHALLDHAVERGATFVDTADNYPFWLTGGLGDESETCLGDWIARRGPAARDRVVLATKLGARPATAGGSFEDALGLGRAVILDQIHASLRRLRTDRVDVLYAHVDDHAVPLAETVGALQETVAQGLTRTIACSNLTAERLAEALRAAGTAPHYAAVQNRFTLLSPDPAADLTPQVLLDDDVQELCTDRGVTMVGYSTLLEGAYTRPDRPVPEHYRRPGTSAALGTLRQVAQETGLDPGQAVLAWLTHRARPVLPVVGVSRAEQIDAAVTAVATEVPAAALTALDDARASAR